MRVYGELKFTLRSTIEPTHVHPFVEVAEYPVLPRTPTFQTRTTEHPDWPYGSGKSNFLDCFDLFKSLTSDLNGFLVHHGGPEGWIWKGKATGESVARLGCEFELGKQGLEYGIAFDTGAGVLVIQREWLAPVNRSKNAKGEPTYVPKRYGPFLDRFAGKIGIRGRAAGNVSTIARTESVLTAYRDPLDKTQITPTARAFSDIRVYRSFDTSPDGSLRSGVSAASPKYPLESDGYNLALVLQQMDFHGSLQRVRQYVNQFSGRFREIKINLEGGRAQLYLEERALAARGSSLGFFNETCGERARGVLIM